MNYQKRALFLKILKKEPLGQRNRVIMKFNLFKKKNINQMEMDEKRLMLKEVYDELKVKGNLSNYSLLEKIASNYDEYMLKKVSDIVLQDNKEVLSLIKEAISENVNLYDLRYFCNLNDKLKK